MVMADTTAGVAFERDYRTIVLSRPRIGLRRFASSPRSASCWWSPTRRRAWSIDERTGTVVIGRDVQISTVAVTHGNLTVRITEAPIVSQPSPFSQRGETVVVAANIHRRQ